MLSGVGRMASWVLVMRLIVGVEVVPKMCDESPDRAVCAVRCEAGVSLRRTDAGRTRTRHLFNVLNVRRFLNGRDEGSRANSGRRLRLGDRTEATQNLEALPSAQK